jgi:hypothetical protein
MIKINNKTMNVINIMAHLWGPKVKEDFNLNINTIIGNPSKMVPLRSSNDIFHKSMLLVYDFINNKEIYSNLYLRYGSKYESDSKLGLAIRREFPKYIKSIKNNTYYSNYVLYKYYDKIDLEVERSKGVKEYSPLFNLNQFRIYVLFAVLKLSGCYKKSMDPFFNVFEKESINNLKDYRLYSPLVNIPGVLRGYLPSNYTIVSYDIKRCYPSLIAKSLKLENYNKETIYDKAVNILIKHNVYREEQRDSLNGKIILNTVCNDTCEHIVIDYKREKEYRKRLKALAEIFNTTVNRMAEVYSREVFDTKGMFFCEQTKGERQAIDWFIKNNNLTNYYTLYDCVYVNEDTIINATEMDEYIEFERQEVSKPPYIKDLEIQIYNITKPIKDGLASNDNIEIDLNGLKRHLMLNYNVRSIPNGVDNILSILRDKERIIEPNLNLSDLTNKVIEDVVEVSELQTAVTNKLRLALTDKLVKSCTEYNDNITIQRDKKDKVYIPFMNGVVCITSKKATLRSYDDEKERFGYFNKVKSATINYNKEEYANSSFFTFLKYNACGKDKDLNEEDKEKLLKFMTSIGYLISNFKDTTNTKSVIFGDERVEGTYEEDARNGRRGKSLLYQALQKVKTGCMIKVEESDSKYKYSSYYNGLDLFIYDDVRYNFNFTELFQDITGDIPLRQMNKDLSLIPFSKSPKILITTNFYHKIPDESSFTDRFYEFRFNPYFYLKNREGVKIKDIVDDVFFAETWTTKDWNSFFSVMIKCVQLYLTYGLIDNSIDRIEDELYKTLNDENKVIIMNYLLLKMSIHENGSMNQQSLYRIYEEGIRDGDIPKKNGKYLYYSKQKDVTNALILFAKHEGIEIERKIGSGRVKYYFMDKEAANAYFLRSNIKLSEITLTNYNYNYKNPSLDVWIE